MAELSELLDRFGSAGALGLSGAESGVVGKVDGQ
jgi:hypothetical protein